MNPTGAHHVGFDDSGHLTPVVGFDFAAVDGETDAPAPDDRSLEESFTRLIAALVRPPWKPQILQRRLIAFGLVLRHREICRHSLSEWARRLNCSPSNLSQIASKCSRDFGIRAPWQKGNLTAKKISPRKSNGVEASGAQKG